MKTQIEALPYVYKLTHCETEQFYLGYRCANVLPPLEDMGKHYFTSSKYVRALGFEKFTVEIIAEFPIASDAHILEQQLIRENIKNPKCLNKHYVHEGKSHFVSPNAGKGKAKRIPKTIHGNKGRKMSDETKAKMSLSRTGLVPTAEHRAAVGTANSRRVWTAESKAKQSASQSGKILPQTQKDAISKSLTKSFLLEDTAGNQFEVSRLGDWCALNNVGRMRLKRTQGTENFSRVIELFVNCRTDCHH